MRKHIQIIGLVSAISVGFLTAGCVSILSPYEALADKKLSGVAESLLDLQAEAQLADGAITWDKDLENRGVALRRDVIVAKGLYGEAYEPEIQERHRQIVVEGIQYCENAVTDLFVHLEEQKTTSVEAVRIMLAPAYTTCLTAAELVQDTE